MLTKHCIRKKRSGQDSHEAAEHAQCRRYAARELVSPQPQQPARQQGKHSDASSHTRSHSGSVLCHARTEALSDCQASLEYCSRVRSRTRPTSLIATRRAHEFTPVITHSKPAYRQDKPCTDTNNGVSPKRSQVAQSPRNTAEQLVDVKAQVSATGPAKQ